MYEIVRITLKPNIQAPTAIEINDIIKNEFSTLNENDYSSYYHVPLDFDILGYDFDYEYEVLVGKIKGYLVKSSWIDNWCDDDILYEFDKISDEIVELYEVLCEHDEIQDKISDEDFYYISELEIKDEFRNKKIGGSLFELIKHIFDFYLKFAVGHIILKSFPLEYRGKYDENNPKINREIENAEERLINFYRRNGFIKIDGEKKFMIR